MRKIFDVDRFRAVTKKVIEAEKHGFWSDWTAEQQQLYMSGDWRAFSISRGYTEEEIENYAEWMRGLVDARRLGLNLFEMINDLAVQAVMKNVALDTRGEILKSSHGPVDDPDRIDTSIQLSDEAWQQYLAYCREYTDSKTVEVSE